MSTARHLGPRILAFLTTMAAVIGCGSGDPDDIPPVPAGGSVTYKGKPVEKGTIQFYPEKGRAASGPITDGKFTLTTNEPNDGAVPGTHLVGVLATKQVPSKTGGEPVDVYVIPEHISDPARSGVAVEVPPDGKTDLLIEIK